MGAAPNPEQYIKAPKGKRVLGFLDGSYWLVDKSTCRGCLMQSKRAELPYYMQPIYEDRDVIVSQDAEFPVPGFYIVSPKKHLGSCADFSVKLSLKVGLITHIVRKGMRDILGIEFAEIYHEERLKNSHYHHWILPCWKYGVDKSGCLPTIFKSKVSGYENFDPNIVSYLRSFDFAEEVDKILNFNVSMRKFVQKSRFVKLIKSINEA